MTQILIRNVINVYITIRKQKSYQIAKVNESTNTETNHFGINESFVNVFTEEDFLMETDSLILWIAQQ